MIKIPHNWIILSNEVLFQFFIPEVDPKIEAQELGLQRMSFTETLRAEVESLQVGAPPTTPSSHPTKMWLENYPKWNSDKIGEIYTHWTHWTIMETEEEEL